jgi:hypothetical protein
VKAEPVRFAGGVDKKSIFTCTGQESRTEPPKDALLLIELVALGDQKVCAPVTTRLTFKNVILRTGGQ